MKRLLAACAIGVCSVSAWGQGGWILEVDHILTFGDETEVTLYATLGPGDHAFAGATLDILVPAGAIEWSNLQTMTIDPSNPGTISGSDVLGIELNMGFPLPLDPIAVWRGTAALTEPAGFVICAKTSTHEFLVWPTSDPEVEPRTAQEDGGLLRIPAPDPTFCYADCDSSGDLTFFDFLCFMNRFSSGSGGADCNYDCIVDLFDFLCFQEAFAEGCE